MKFKTQISDLLSAISLASVVRPRSMDSAGSAGYLFVAEGDTCFIYSEDDHQKSRVSFSITDLEGDDAPFVFPVNEAEQFRYLDGQVTLESKVEDNGGTFILEYETEGGAKCRIPTLDPKIFHALDTDLEGAETKYTFPVNLLRDAVTLAKPYIADPKDPKAKEPHKFLQLFDKSKPEWEKGNGNFFASDGYRAFYFYCPDLTDRGLSLHGLRLPLLSSFLGKSSGEVTLKKSAKATYLVNSEDHVIGWADSVVEHGKFSYYAYEADSHIWRIPKEPLIKALNHVRKALDSKQSKVRFEYNHERTTVQILAAHNGKDIKSVPVLAVPLDGADSTAEAPIKGGSLSKTENLGCNLDIDWLIDLVSSVKDHHIQLRMGAFPKRPGEYLVRSIESFLVDDTGKVHIAKPEDQRVYQCQVTRFMPTKT